MSVVVTLYIWFVYLPEGDRGLEEEKEEFVHSIEAVTLKGSSCLRRFNGELNYFYFQPDIFLNLLFKSCRTGY